MTTQRDPAEAIGTVTHYFNHLMVAAVNLTAPLDVGEKIHIHGHTTDVIETVTSMEIDHKPVSHAEPGDDIAINVTEHVRDHDKIYRVP
jgi:putative protease